MSKLLFLGGIDARFTLLFVPWSVLRVLDLTIALGLFAAFADFRSAAFSVLAVRLEADSLVLTQQEKNVEKNNLKGVDWRAARDGISADEGRRVDAVEGAASADGCVVAGAASCVSSFFAIWE